MSSEPIISVSGLRGIIGESLTPDVAIRYACAFSSQLDSGPIVVTRDGGPSSSSLNFSRNIRILENPLVHVAEPLDYSSSNPRPSPVERCVVRRLRRPRRGRMRSFMDGAEWLSTRHPDYFRPDRSAWSRRVALRMKIWNIVSPNPNPVGR